MLAFAAAEPAPTPTIELVVVLLGGREEPWPREQVRATSPPGAPFSKVRFRREAVYERTAAELMAWGGLGVLFGSLAVDADAAAVRQAAGELKSQVRSRRELADLGER